MKTLLVLALAACPVFSHEPVASEADRAVPAAPLAPRPLSLPVPRESSLANGMRLAFAEVRRVPVVGFEIVLPLAGAAGDPVARNGLASVIAELIKEGAGSLGQEDLETVLEGIGVRLEVKVIEDAARVIVFGAKENVDQAMGLVAGALRRPAIAREDFERLRDDKAVEARQPPEPGAAADHRVAARLYEGHPYGRPRPTAEGLGRLRLQDARAYYAQRVRPEGAVVAGSGDMRFEDFEAVVRRHFGSWRASPSSAAVPEVAGVPLAPDAAQGGPVIELVHASGAAQSALRVGHLAAPRSSPDYPALRLVNYLLRERVNANLRERHGWTYSPESNYGARRQGGAIVVAADVQTDKTAPALTEILAELEAMRTGLASASELEEAKTWYRAEARKLPKVQDLAENLGHNGLNGVAQDLSGGLDAILAVSAEQLRDAARRYLRPEAVRIVVAGDSVRVAAGLRALGTVRIVDADGRELAPPANAAG